MQSAKITSLPRSGTVQDVCDWLTSHDFPDGIVSDFQLKSVDAAELLEIHSLAELEEITKSGRTTQRKKLLRMIQTIKQQEGEFPTTIMGTKTKEITTTTKASSVAPSVAPSATPSVAPSVAATAALKCIVCTATSRENGAKLLRCSRCKSTRYCSSRCQKLDWQRHKTSCTKQNLSWELFRIILRGDYLNNEAAAGVTVAALLARMTTNVNATCGSLDVSQFGIDVLESDTPLIVACAEGYSYIVRELLQHPNINVNKCNDVLQTPLTVACEGEHEETIHMLLDMPGVDVLAQDKWGDTAIKLAHRAELSAIEEILRERGAVIESSEEEEEEEEEEKEEEEEEEEEEKMRMWPSIQSTGAANIMIQNPLSFRNVSPMHVSSNKLLRLCSNEHGDMSSWLEELFADDAVAAAAGVHRRPNKQFLDFHLSRSYSELLHPDIVLKLTALYQHMHDIATVCLRAAEVECGCVHDEFVRYAEPCGPLKSRETEPIRYGKDFYDASWSSKDKSVSYLSIHRYTNKNEEINCKDHVDRGLITIIVAPCSSGLQVKTVTQDGVTQWTEADECPAQFELASTWQSKLSQIVMPGATLRRITGGAIAATAHRVKLPKSFDTRISIVFKLHAVRNQRFVPLQEYAPNWTFPIELTKPSKVHFQNNGKTDEDDDDVEVQQMESKGKVENELLVDSVGETVGTFLDTFDRTHCSVNYESGGKRRKEGEEKHETNVVVTDDKTTNTSSTNFASDVSQFIWCQLQAVSMNDPLSLFSFDDSDQGCLPSLTAICCKTLVKNMIQFGPDSQLMNVEGSRLDMFAQELLDVCFSKKSNQEFIAATWNNSFPLVLMIFSHLYGGGHFENKEKKHSTFAMQSFIVPLELNLSAPTNTNGEYRGQRIEDFAGTYQALVGGYMPRFLSDSLFCSLISSKFQDLESLDLSNQQALTSVSIEHLAAVCPRLKVLKLSGAIQLHWWSQQMCFNFLEELHLNDRTMRTDQILGNCRGLLFPVLKLLHLTGVILPGLNSVRLAEIAPNLQLLDMRDDRSNNRDTRYDRDSRFRQNRQGTTWCDTAPFGLRVLLLKGSGLLEGAVDQRGEFLRKMEHLQLPDSLFLPFKAYCEHTPKLKILEIFRLSDVAFRGDLNYNHRIASFFLNNVHQTLQKIVMPAIPEIQLQGLVLGAPNLEIVELRQCKMRYTVNSFDDLIHSHRRLQSINIRQSFHLFDTRNWESGDTLPPVEYEEMKARDFQIKCTDIGYLRSHQPHGHIIVKDQGGGKTWFKARPTTKMGKVFRAYATRKEVAITSLRFLIDGERIDAAETPISMELYISHDPEDTTGDQIDCLLEQRGD